MFATVAVFKWILRRLKLVNITDSGRETSLPIWHLGCDTVLIFTVLDGYFLPSVLWRCWLGGRKGIRPVKNLEWWGTGMVICLERGANLHMAQLMPLPLTVSCSSKIQIGFTLLVAAHLGSPGKRAVKRCVCVCDGYFTLCQRAWLLVAGWLDTEPGQRPTASVAAWIVVSLLRPQTCALDSASWRRSWCRCQRCDCSSETTGPTDTRTQPAATVQACQFYATF